MQLSSEALADLEQAAMEAAEDADAQLEEASALRVCVSAARCQVQDTRLRDQVDEVHGGVM